MYLKKNPRVFSKHIVLDAQMELILDDDDDDDDELFLWYG